MGDRVLGGVRDGVDHDVGQVVVEVTAAVVHVDGRLVRLSVAARQQGRLVGSGEVTRVVVGAEKFMSRLG